MTLISPASSEAQALRGLGDRLKSTRLAMNIPAAELAGQLGISRSTLHAVESGAPSPSISAYLVVMSALGIPGGLSMLTDEPLPDVRRVRARRASKTPAGTLDEQRQRRALAQGKAALTELRKIGVEAELVGSVVWGKFHTSSDVDFLIIDDGGASDGTLYDKIASMVEFPVDLVFLDRLRPVSRELLLKQRAENGLAPLSVKRGIA